MTHWLSWYFIILIGLFIFLSPACITFYVSQTWRAMFWSLVLFLFNDGHFTVFTYFFFLHKKSLEHNRRRTQGLFWSFLSYFSETVQFLKLISYIQQQQNESPNVLALIHSIFLFKIITTGSGATWCLVMHFIFVPDEFHAYFKFLLRILLWHAMRFSK